MSEKGQAALAAAKQRQDDIVNFLRGMIAIRAESCHEQQRCEFVKAEYEKLGFDEVFFDSLGTVVARIGSGPLKILVDGHIDTVGVGDPASWDFDPFEGKLEDGEIWGRGAVDQLPGIVSAAYGARLLMDRGFPEGITLYLSASVMEEDCDGYSMLHLIEKEGIRPNLVVLTEPTNLAVFRGHRGRMEVSITTHGKSAHGAHAERGVNALYKMAPIMLDIEELNKHLADDAFLGKGSVIVSTISVDTPSANAVPDRATITLDRRMTAGETVDSALAELRALPHLGDADVKLLEYRATSWRGTEAYQEKYFPTWVLDEEHPLVQGTAAAAEEVFGHRPEISRWHFSTNGVATMGRLGIPSVGFAPGREELAHSTDEHVPVDDLVTGAAVFSLIPEAILEAHKS